MNEGSVNMSVVTQAEAEPVTFWCGVCQAWVDAPHACPPEAPGAHGAPGDEDF